MSEFYLGCLVGGLLGVVGLGLLLVVIRLSQPLDGEVSAAASNELYRALRVLAYTTQSQTADVVELVEAWVAGEKLDAVLERIQAENED